MINEDSELLAAIVIAEPWKAKELTIPLEWFGHQRDLIQFVASRCNQDDYDWSALYSDALNHFGVQSQALQNVVSAPEFVRSMTTRRNVAPIEKRLRAHYNRIEMQGILRDMLTGLERGSDKEVNDGITKLLSINRGDEKHDFSFTEMLDNALRWVQDRESGVLHGVNCGFASLTRSLGAFHNSDLIVVAARSAMGKTAFLVNLAIRAGCKPGFISAEQPNDQIGLRTMVIDSSTNMQDLRSGHLTVQTTAQLKHSLTHLKTIDGRIYDKPNCTIGQVQAKAREWVGKYGIEALYVDYLQNIRANDQRKPKHEQVAEVAQGLKDIGRELQIPVIALAQVNRDVEKRPDKRPSMSDIKDSGTIEQEADQILTLYRDDYYNPDSDQKGLIEVDVKKNRHGQTGCILMRWNAPSMQFIDMEEEQDLQGWDRDSDPLWGQDRAAGE